MWLCRFAERAKEIQNVAKVNVDPAYIKLLELMEENVLLSAENMKFRDLLQQ